MNNNFNNKQSWQHPLHTAAEVYVPGRQAPVAWPGHGYSRQYSEQHQQESPDLDEYYDEFVTKKFPRTDPNRPGMYGMSYFQRAPQHPVYGTSGPFPVDGQMGPYQWDVVQARLNEIPPAAFANVRSPNMVGHCCEYATIPPQLEEFTTRLGTLHTVVSISRRGYHRHSDRQRFCPGCAIFAGQLADLYPGLTIQDGATGQEYQSHVTKKAHIMEEEGQSPKEISEFLQSEADKIKTYLEADAAGSWTEVQGGSSSGSSNRGRGNDRGHSSSRGHGNRGTSPGRGRGESSRGFPGRGFRGGPGHGHSSSYQGQVRGAQGSGPRY